MTIAETIERRRERLMDLYTAAGLPVTSQRRVLFSVLAERFDHPTVDQIYSGVSERLPETSRTTVYRSLEVLADLKLLRRIEHPGSAVRFDPNMEPHHHFLCITCEELTDLPMDAVVGHDGLRFAGDARVEVEELTVLARGTCEDCAKAS